MNVISVNHTAENTKKYPLHTHGYWEVMYYTDGVGYLATSNADIPFKAGSIIIVPPETAHGSVSENGFVNISVGGEFGRYFMFKHPVSLFDTCEGEGAVLAGLVYSNRYSDTEFLSALCTAYISFLLQNIECENGINRTLGEIINSVTENCTDPMFCITNLLQKSGYAEDYIRSEFKKKTGLTPVKFLTKIRIEHAKRLFQIYGNAVSVSEVAEKSGFYDPIYFSKRFKQSVGVSPEQYKNGNSKKCSK